MVARGNNVALITKNNALIEISILIDILQERLKQGGDVVKICRDLERVSSYLVKLA